MNNCLECKHFKRSERIGVKCCEFGLDSNYCEKDKEDFAIVELQNIAIDLIPKMESIDDRISSYIKAETVFRIINKHIAELKGE